MKKLLLALCALCALAGLSEAQTLCNEVIPAVAVSCPVDGTTGVTAGKYARWNSAGTALVIGATTDGPGAYIGVAAATQVGGTGIFYISGSISPIFDGATTANDYACLSSMTAGDFTDCGAIASAKSLGRINSTIGSAGPALAWIWGHFPEAVPSTAATTCPSLIGANNYVWNTLGTSGAFGCTLPAAQGTGALQVCIGNGASSGRTASTGVITVTAASGDYIMNASGTFGSTGGTEVSGGAAADLGCFVSMQANQWRFIPTKGTWTP